jgi:hypothetical protein
MQQRPQAPQMPTPGKASPMAGLGSVDDRVSAYQGNTKPLEQRYAMTQDLLDLLALQKIKSQKEAAARQMQLQMAQQGQQDGQANMTVADQRAQEVDALTKNELAAQRGDTAQKQAGDQQAMMQKLMGGIAGAPGANAAAQPKAMAAGGIIGYADGGAVGYAGGGDVDAARARRRAAQQKLQSFGTMQRRSDPDGYAAAQQELEAAQTALQEAEGAYAGEMSAAGVDRPAFSRRDVGAVKGAMQQAAGPLPTAPAPARLPVSEAQATAAAGPQAAVPPASVVAAAQPPRPPAPAAPKPPAPAGIAGLPGAAPAGPAVGPANDFGTKLEAAALKNAEIDPAARQLAEEQRVESRLALKPEQRKVYEEGIGGLQSMYQEEYDPERLRREGIKRALIGAGGRRYGELGAAAGAGMAYDDRMRAAKLKEFGDVQKARTGLIDLDRGVVEKGIGAGQKDYEQGSLSQRQGLDSGTKLYGTDVDTRNKALDREIERLKVKAQQDATAATREGLSYDKARTVYATTMGRAQELERKLDDDFAKQNGMLLMQEQAGKLDPAQKNQLETAKLMLQQQKAKLRKELEPVLASARKQLGVTDMDNLSAADKATIEKYTKGK